MVRDCAWKISLVLIQLTGAEGCQRSSHLGMSQLVHFHHVALPDGWIVEIKAYLYRVYCQAVCQAGQAAEAGEMWLVAEDRMTS